MDLLNEISGEKFALVLVNEKQYEQELQKLVSVIEKANHNKICYVCLSKPYKDVIANLKTLHADVEKFFFIDILSSHYQKPEKVKNCLFLSEPIKMINLQVAIEKVICKEGCTHVIFDTLSSLLLYEQSHEIVKFSNHLSMTEQHQDINKVFIVLKDIGATNSEYNQLIKDVSMFTSRVVELEGD